jgi:hypothetical protein
MNLSQNTRLWICHRTHDNESVTGHTKMNLSQDTRQWICHRTHDNESVTGHTTMNLSQDTRQWICRLFRVPQYFYNSTVFTLQQKVSRSINLRDFLTHSGQPCVCPCLCSVSAVTHSILLAFKGHRKAVTLSLDHCYWHRTDFHEILCVKIY